MTTGDKPKKPRKSRRTPVSTPSGNTSRRLKRPVVSVLIPCDAIVTLPRNTGAVPRLDSSLISVFE